MERAPPRRLLPVLVRAAAANAISGMRASVLRGRAPMQPDDRGGLWFSCCILLLPFLCVRVDVHLQLYSTIVISTNPELQYSRS